ncbi:MAG: helix-hairpin-helix domain-containing protein [Flavobacteriales bacterium]|nr:helix-hairpin-helix domain-containing protein [Flavobacteriales bacterium]MBL1232900.1 helix-hairpin-helix domain-containing protein [Flavobacteriales bacterium]
MSIKEYFSFTKSEKRGVIVLLIILLLILFSFPFVDYLKQQNTPDFMEYEDAILAFEKELNEQENEQNQAYQQKNKQALSITLFDFDPNTISDEEWKQLGFRDWQIKIINNYKAKGGNWKIKADVKKIYGISDKHYELLFPHILLPETIEKTNYQYDKPVKKSVENKFEKKDYSQKIDINTADSAMLTNIKGIGPAYSSRIIKYRDLLGGFIAKEQLKEVWGLSEETYQIALPQIVVSDRVQKININKATADVLKQHPYINWKIANAIEKYRKANGSYKSVADLNKLHLLDKATIEKISPYLGVE